MNSFFYARTSLRCLLPVPQQTSQGRRQGAWRGSGQEGNKQEALREVGGVGCSRQGKVLNKNIVK